MTHITDQPVALITGASRGIGRAIALELARKQFAVVVNFLQNKGAAQAVLDELTASGGRGMTLAADVASPVDRNRLVQQTMAEFGRIDVLVNNAGITSQGRMDLLEATEESWDRVFDTNLKGPFFLAQSVARQMIDLQKAETITRGYIINISSISAYAVSTNRADYCMTKAAMQMMTWLLADRLADAGIRVYEICPGVIASDMTAPVREKYDKLIAEGLTPIRRWGQPEDVARVVAALVGGALPFSTGERINVDGGFHIRRL